MKYICHRGNINGPQPNEENNPNYITQALRLGYDVEIDVRLINNTFWLGHDIPQYKINTSFLENNKLWIHCKNVETFLLLSNNSKMNCFFQTNEEIVMTSRGYLWAHYKCSAWNDNTVIVRLDKQEHKYIIEPFAVCSDYILF